ncbi:MAG: CRISPR-associated helicase Cas3' [Candidatus Methanoperedens sp.]|nr:CRISPR-associated helicase Cas3' [Candidatus Methanoperedens sp.]MCZ7361773.1 CRISPR-associated helicase Cas3' [Candidatus Methanoperedens sp.]HLB72069.1 CRISPR-associated helicase Cas3' [Candidatus Methanoperedens sp.]
MKKCPICHIDLTWETNNKYFQTLHGHTIDSVKILRAYIETNFDVIEQFCDRWQLNRESFLKSLFITVYLHDIGKLTTQFQENIRNGRSSQKYPHAFYSQFILNEIDFSNLLDVPIEKAAILGHHTQLYSQLYAGDEGFDNPSFLEKDINAFVRNSKDIYIELGFDKWFLFDGLDINSLPESRKFWGILRDYRNDLITETSSFDDKEKLKSIFCYIFSILETCDDYSSAEFSEFISEYSSNDSVFDSVMKEPTKYVPWLYVDNPYEKILGENSPYDYQKDEPEKLCGDVPFYGLLFAPCGRGKTETALIWALKAMRKYKRNKIVFAMPTQITSNAMWERFCRLFDKYLFSLDLKYDKFLQLGAIDSNLIIQFENNKHSLSSKAIVLKLDEKKWKISDGALEYILKEEDSGLSIYESGKKYVGLFHGKSFIKLKGEKKREKEDDEDLTTEDLDEVKGETFKGNVFFKPITVTTIDHLIYSFIHGFSQADFTLGNLQNAVIVFDEVHYYEKNLDDQNKSTLDHLATLLQILKEMKIPNLLMSGTLPDFFVKEVKQINSDYEGPYTDNDGLFFEPFKLNISKEKLVTKEAINKEIIDEIIENYNKGLVQFIILNTIERSKSIYDALITNLPQSEEHEKIILHHSQFTYQDRADKERDILQKLNKEKLRPFILVATQVIEISLDISCDIMYTELAPGDALGQRGGRLNRKGQTWISNDFEHAMKIFMPEELDKDKPKKRPYDLDLLKKTLKVIEDGPCSYFKLKKLCDEVYSAYRLITPTSLRNVFNECCIFGYSPKNINFGDEEKGRLIQIRSDEVQKFDVIPWEYYDGDERNLIVENQAKVPIWWYKQDEKEHGELFCFNNVSKKVGRKDKNYWITRIPYSKQKGFNFKKPLDCPPPSMSVII